MQSNAEYTLHVRVEPTTFMRHDEINGRRFAEPVEVEFRKVKVKRGQEMFKHKHDGCVRAAFTP